MPEKARKLLQTTIDDVKDRLKRTEAAFWSKMSTKPRPLMNMDRKAGIQGAQTKISSAAAKEVEAALVKFKPDLKAGKSEVLREGKEREAEGNAQREQANYIKKFVNQVEQADKKIMYNTGLGLHITAKEAIDDSKEAVGQVQIERKVSSMQ